MYAVCLGTSFINGKLREDENITISSITQAAILDLKSIRRNYLKSWFVPDIIAAFPVGYIILIAVRSYYIIYIYIYLKQIAKEQLRLCEYQIIFDIQLLLFFRICSIMMSLLKPIKWCGCLCLCESSVWCGCCVSPVWFASLMKWKK